jgi:hypothetical protein
MISGQQSDCKRLPALLGLPLWLAFKKKNLSIIGLGHDQWHQQSIPQELQQSLTQQQRPGWTGLGNMETMISIGRGS